MSAKSLRLPVKKRYAIARALLYSNKKNIAIKYYNSYPSGTKTLKVYFWYDGNNRVQLIAVVRELAKLSDYHNIGQRGGEIFGFHFQRRTK